MGTPGAFLYSPRGLRLRRRGAYSPRLTHRLRGVSPQGKRLTMICESLALLHPLLSLTHWIFRSLMLPYKSSSHSAKCVRCAPRGQSATLGAKGPVKLKNPWAEGPSILRTFPYTTLLHNPPPKGGHNPRAGGPSTLTPAGRVQRRVQSFLCPT